MTGANYPMLLPILAQVGLTIFVVLLLGFQRVSAIRKMGIEAIRRDGFPAKAEQTSANFKHQFEAPILFYVIAILFVTSLDVTPLALIFAWAFVALRYMHALIQLTHNTIFPWRFGSFIVGVFFLICLYFTALLQVIPG